MQRNYLFNFKYSKEYFAEIVEESELQPYGIWLFPAGVMRESPSPTKNLLIPPSSPPGKIPPVDSPPTKFLFSHPPMKG